MPWVDENSSARPGLRIDVTRATVVRSRGSGLAMSSKDVSSLMGVSTAVVVAFVEELHWVIVRPTSGTSKETLENPTTLRDNGRVIAGVNRVHGHQAARLW